uniref:Uncharacterized protein n=1 Tax=Ananas comosus var. bracteatus TaxID=296719 RepID=A0A6V7PGK3_ANACO|nr:unnamed protein product [Ananas comosus var. bracteatus]
MALPSRITDQGLYGHFSFSSPHSTIPLAPRERRRRRRGRRRRGRRRRRELVGGLDLHPHPLFFLLVAWTLDLELERREISTLGGLWILIRASKRLVDNSVRRNEGLRDGSRHDEWILETMIRLFAICAHSHMLVRVAPYKPALRSWPTRLMFARAVSRNLRGREG